MTNKELKIENETIEKVLNIIQFKAIKKGWLIPSNKQLMNYIDYWWDDSSYELVKKYLKDNGYTD